MKPIRPLFHNPWARVRSPGQQCYDAFERWVDDPLRGRGEIPPNARRGTLRVKKVKRPDGHGYRFIAQPTKKFLCVSGIVEWARKRGRLLTEETGILRKFLMKSLLMKTYREWLSSSGMADFFYEDDWTPKENYRKYTWFVTACFVGFFRLGQIDWRTPNESDMGLAGKLLRAFAPYSRIVERQREFIALLFDLREKLADIAVTRRERLSEKDQAILLKHVDKSGEELARALEADRFEGLRESPLTIWQRNPNSFRALISKRRREMGLWKRRRSSAGRNETKLFLTS